MVSWVTEDSADLSAVVGQDERRRYRYGPLKQYAGNRLVSNMDATQGRERALNGPRISRGNFCVPTLTPHTVGPLEHQQLGAPGAGALGEANKRPHGGTADKRYELPPLHLTTSRQHCAGRAQDNSSFAFRVCAARRDGR